MGRSLWIDAAHAYHCNTLRIIKKFFSRRADPGRYGVHKWLDDRFKEQIPDERERIKFILASYNIGPGHIFDAISLAEKFGKD